MATCRACGEPIEFRRTRLGHWRPYDPDGTVHFATCRSGWVYDVRRFRRRFTGRPVAEETSQKEVKPQI